MMKSLYSKILVLILVTLITKVQSEHSRNDLNATSTTQEKDLNNTALTSLDDIFNYNDNNQELYEDSSEPRIFNKLNKFKYKLQRFDIKRSLKKVFHAWAYYSPEIGFCKCVSKSLWFSNPFLPKLAYTFLGRSKSVLNMFYQEFMKGFEAAKHSKGHSSYGPPAESYGPPTFSAGTPLSSYGPPYNQYHRVDLNAEDETSDLVDNTHLFKLQVKSLTEKPPKLTLDQSKIQVALNTLNLISSKQQNTSPNGTGRSSESGRNLRSGTNFVSSKLNLPPPDHTYFKDGTYYHIHDLRAEKGVYGGPKFLRSDNDDFENAILSLLGLGPPGKFLKPSISVCSQQYAISALVRFMYKYFF